ncbi:MAG: C40 family peptidase [Saccharofermentans sp.]|nr:C40 family peptidase [Saccharofermentans sp.]
MVFKHNRKQNILAIAVAFFTAVPVICLPVGIRNGINPGIVLKEAYEELFGVQSIGDEEVVIEDWALVSDVSELVEAPSDFEEGEPAEADAMAVTEDYSDISKYIVYQQYDESDLPIELLDTQCFAADNTTYYVRATQSILKEEPNMDSVTLKSLHLGQRVTRIGIGDTWSKIQTEDGSEGYVLTGSIQDTMLSIEVDDVVWVDTDSLIVRAEPSTNSEEVLVVNDETKLYVSAIVGDKWYKVTTTGGQSGYVYMSYTTHTPPPTPTPTPTPRPRSSSGGSSGSSGSSQSYGDTSRLPVITGVNGESIVSIAESMLGVPYVYAGESRSGIDCSGLVKYCYAQVGIYVPHGATQIYRRSGVSVPRSEIALGDVVCYDYGSYCGHVAIYVGGGQVIHASNSRGNVRYGNVDMMAIKAIKRLIQ